MQDMTTDAQTIAGEAYGWFETRTRDDGASYVAMKDDRPQWVYDAVYEAHGDMLPDDRIFKLCRDAFGFISDNDADENPHEFADDAVDVYTTNRTAWLASHPDRLALCDEAAGEFGGAMGPISERIGWGQYLEASRVYAAIWAAVEARSGEVDA